MSESTRTPLKPRDIRRCAYALMRQCWLTLLLAAVLMSLLGWVSDVIEYHGDNLGQLAYDAHMEAFYTENPPPDDLTDYAVWAYFDEYFAINDAEALASKSSFLWKLGAHAIDLVDSLFSAVVMVGLYAGLLTHLRGGTCSPAQVFSKHSLWKTIVWLDIRITVCILGWGLLFLLPAIMLEIMLGPFGKLVRTFILMWVFIWASLRYTLVFPHMADDPDGQLTTSACLDAGVQDMRFFTVRGLIRTLWPVCLVAVFVVALIVAEDYIAWLKIPAAVFTTTARIFIQMTACACYVFIYDELRQRTLVTPENEGLARARALAQEESLN